MVDPNQNFILSLKKELNECSYARSMTDYLANMIIRIMNYPKKIIPPRYFVKVTEQNKIIFIWYPMSVPFKNKNFNIPIQIFITKNIPYEPPQIFLEVGQGSAPSTLNKDIDQNNNRIMTQGLRNWNQYSNVENVLGEIFESFSKAFPLYKKNQLNNKHPHLHLHLLLIAVVMEIITIIIIIIIIPIIIRLIIIIIKIIIIIIIIIIPIIILIIIIITIIIIVTIIMIIIIIIILVINQRNIKGEIRTKKEIPLHHQYQRYQKKK